MNCTRSIKAMTEAGEGQRKRERIRNEEEAEDACEKQTVFATPPRMEGKGELTSMLVSKLEL